MEVRIKDALYGTICHKRENGRRRRIFTPLNEQPMPSEVISLHRAYIKNKWSPEYKRRVSSWTDDRPTAVVEYIGTFPGFSPHGNDLKTRPRKYIRTKLLKQMKCDASMHKPSEVIRKRANQLAPYARLFTSGVFQELSTADNRYYVTTVKKIVALVRPKYEATAISSLELESKARKYATRMHKLWRQ